MSDLFQLVNGVFSVVIPKTVAEHYGNVRKKSALGHSVKYSLSFAPKYKSGSSTTGSQGSTNTVRDDTTSVEGSIANVTNANALISTPKTSVGTAPIDSLSQKSDKSSGDVQFSLSNPVEEKYNSLYDARALEVIEIKK